MELTWLWLILADTCGRETYQFIKVTRAAWFLRFLDHTELDIL